MMQKCSELGKNSMAWQHLVRLGQSNLKVKKGPNGHYLDKRCRDELEKSLPAKSFKELMVWVAKWMKRLDEKNGMVHSRKDSAAKPEEIKANTTNPAVVDLCSDGEDGESIDTFLDGDLLDSDSVISNSSLVVLDDELGEVNLKDYADHVDGKLDAASIKKWNNEEMKTTFSAKKQTTMKKYLTPTKTQPDTSPPNVLRRSLKTYGRKMKASPIGGANNVATDTEKRSSLILRELNIEGGTNFKTSAKEETQPDLIIIDDVSQENSVKKEENNELLIREKTKPKTNDAKPISPIVNEELQSNALANNETSTCDSLNYNETKSKSTANIPLNEAIMTDAEKPLKTNGEAKENSEPRKPNSSEFQVFEKVEPSPPKSEDPKLILTINDSLKIVDIKSMPIGKEVLLADSLSSKDTSPKNIERRPLVSAPMDFIRVRTDLIAPVEPLNQGQVEQIAPAQPSNPAAEKRRLQPEPEAYRCESATQSIHGQPKRPAKDNYIPASVTTSRYPPNIPVTAVAVNASIYPHNGGFAPVIPVAAPPVVPGAAGVHLTNTIYSSIMPMAPGSVNSLMYRGPRYLPGIATTSSYQGINPSYPPVMSATPASRYPPPIIVAPVPVDTSTNQPIRPVPPAPVVVSSTYQPINPVAPAPATSSSFQPNIAVAPAAPDNYNSQLSGRDPRSDLANIMGMLAQVELFAYGQKNQEAFHLVNQLRISLQRGSANNGQAPQ
uniref:Pollen-specific leucine-rich repeat extensin-like protein 1 n=1 Tax=Drosophila rhopaloa TaxID=1041015 RepID=A0A6P4DYE0_DRORH